MISDRDFDIDLKENLATLISIKQSPSLFIDDYLKKIINDIDIFTETFISKKLTLIEKDVNFINSNRDLMIEYLLNSEKLFNKAFDKKKFDMDLLPKINSLLNDSIHSNVCENVSNHLRDIKNHLFQGKWFFFKGNKKAKGDELDFGRLIVIDYLLSEKISRDFNKIADFENPANLKRFILSKNKKSLCNEFMIVYAISKQISIKLNDIKNQIIEINQNDIFKINEICFERYDLYSIEQIVLNDQFNCLKDIDLSHNKINHLTDVAFLNLKNLTNLNLSFNKIEKLESNIFCDLCNLQDLDLSNNRLNLIDKNALSGLKCLKKLDLSGNQLEYLTSGAFDRLLSLTDLDLSCNNFKSINKNVFDGLNSLEKLYLNSNEIEFIESDSFKQLLNFKELHLNMNKLKKIESNWFNQLDLLSKIDLRFNEIKSIDKESFKCLKSIKNVLLYGNIDLIHDIDPRDFFRLNENNEQIFYLTFDGNYYDSECEDEDEDEETDEDEMDYESNNGESDEDREEDNYDSDY